MHFSSPFSGSLATSESQMNGVYSALLLLVAAPALLATAAHTPDLSKYPFYRTLYDDQGQYYGLYWNFSIAAKTIHFAVNVSTEGWVGFGVSPNGQMPGSDVVIGWVAGDRGLYFHVSRA